MKPGSFALAAIVALLCLAPQAQANIPSVYYQNDPGYGYAFRREASVGFAILFVYASAMLLGIVRWKRSNIGGRLGIALFMIGATYFLLAIQFARTGTRFMAGDRSPENAAIQSEAIRTLGRTLGLVNPNDPTVSFGPNLFGGGLAAGCALGGVFAIRYLRRPKDKEPIKRPVIPRT